MAYQLRGVVILQVSPNSTAHSPLTLDRLKLETAEKHEAVEAALNLLSPDLTVERYASVLRFMAATFMAWEDALACSCRPMYSALWSGREKAWRAVDDLVTLGYSPTVERMQWSVPLDSAGVWLGSLYVMEGSTLGGQFISRHLEQRFGWSDGRGYSFFRPYGAQTGERWKAVCSAIREAPRMDNQIVSGAHLTYNLLLASLPR